MQKPKALSHIIIIIKLPKLDIKEPKEREEEEEEEVWWVWEFIQPQASSSAPPIVVPSGSFFKNVI